jgi:WD40 repeat protein
MEGLLHLLTLMHAYMYDITNSELCPIESFIGHIGHITSFVFSSPTSLISASWDRSVKFWQIGASSISPDVTDSKSILHTSSIKSITLQAKDGIAISSDSDGVVRTWDLSTGHCKGSFQTPAKGDCLRDVQLIDNRLVLVWYAAEEIHIWDVEKRELLQTVDAPWGDICDLRISGDGSKVFCMEWNIHAWYIWTGEAMGSVSWKGGRYRDSFLSTDSSRVWVHLPGGIKGWDFGVSDSLSTLECTEPPNRPHLDFIGGIRKQKSLYLGLRIPLLEGNFFSYL